MNSLRSFCVALILNVFVFSGIGICFDEPTSNRTRSLRFVPRDANAVVSIQVHALLSSKLMADSKNEFAEQTLPMFPVQLADLSEVTIAVLQDGVCANLTLSSQGTDSFWKRIRETSRESVMDGVPYFKTRDGVFHRLKEGGVLFANNELVLTRSLKTESAESTNWASQWQAAKSPVVAIVNTSLLRGNGILELLRYDRSPGGRDSYQRPPSEVFTLATRSDRIWLEFQPDPDAMLSLRGQCPTAEEAVTFESGVRTSLSWVRNLISVARRELFALSLGGAKEEILPLLDFADRLLEYAIVQRRDTQVAAVAKVSEADSRKLPGWIAMAFKSLSKSRGSAQSKNNLKQIALAMHNYESAYKKFPAAVQVGPNNMPRSWRVTILPYLEQGDLYNRYKHDEPWDSPSNLKLLDEIPAVYQSAKGGSNAGYFVFDGNNAIFKGNIAPRFSQMTDGTSNTILAIEAELDIPWTKPQDIPFDMNQELPAFLKKGFNAVGADGAAHFIPPNVPEAELKKAISANEGEIHNLFNN